MKCSKCGTENPEGSFFCQECGAKLEKPYGVGVSQKEQLSSPPEMTVGMTILRSIKVCLIKYFEFKGRASRAEFWWWEAFMICVSFVLSFTPSSLSLMFLLLTFFPSLAVSVRRYHDSNHSGWWILCPVVNLVLLFYASEQRTNDYGSCPE